MSLHKQHFLNETTLYKTEHPYSRCPTPITISRTIIFLISPTFFFWKRDSEQGGVAEGEEESQADSALSTEHYNGFNLWALKSSSELKSRMGA